MFLSDRRASARTVLCVRGWTARLPASFVGVAVSATPTSRSMGPGVGPGVVGPTVGAGDGFAVGVTVGAGVGRAVGPGEGAAVGFDEGSAVGAPVGPGVGPAVGFDEGAGVVGCAVGAKDDVGANEGKTGAAMPGHALPSLLPVSADCATHLSSKERPCWASPPSPHETWVLPGTSGSPVFQQPSRPSGRGMPPAGMITSKRP